MKPCLSILVSILLSILLLARASNAEVLGGSESTTTEESSKDTLTELQDATIEVHGNDAASSSVNSRDGLDFSALLNVKQHLRSVVNANLDEFVTSDDESTVLVSKAETNDQLLSQQSESFLQQRERVLAELEVNSGERRQLWSIEEIDKQRCCAAAFELCEKPPTMKSKHFWKIKNSLLKRARRACDNMGILSRLNEKTICSFYKGHPMNCAMTPNTAKDMDRYVMQAKVCCLQSPVMCDNMDNATVLYNAKRECLYFAATTPEDICGMQDTATCTGEWRQSGEASSKVSPSP